MRRQHSRTQQGEVILFPLLISQVITISKEKLIPSLIFHSVLAFENMEITRHLYEFQSMA